MVRSQTKGRAAKSNPCVSLLKLTVKWEPETTPSAIVPPHSCVSLQVDVELWMMAQFEVLTFLVDYLMGGKFLIDVDQIQISLETQNRVTSLIHYLGWRRRRARTIFFKKQFRRFVYEPCLFLGFQETLTVRTVHGDTSRRLE